ncbi:MAG: ABC transporter permease subunit [Steroidobacteraceae bacterium]|nr:ABC transporter permease subunit [Steroidobacteraceae bacterium]
MSATARGPRAAAPGAPLRGALATGARLGLARRLVIGLPYFWLLLFFLVPFLIVLKISLSTTALRLPPYEPLVTWAADGVMQVKLHWSNFGFVLGDELYRTALLNSIEIAGVSTLICLLIGYPMAYGIARAPSAWRNVLFLLVALPFFTSFLLRVYAWIGLLGRNGPVNDLLLALGLVDQPLQLLQTDFAVYVGMVYSYLPFMVLPLYAAIEKLDLTLLEAAADLGARPVKTFFTVTLPLTKEGIFAGCLLVFIPAVGEFVIPALLGGPDTLMIGRVVWDEFFSNRDWPIASAIAILMLVLLLGFVVLLQRLQSREGRA